MGKKNIAKLIPVKKTVFDPRLNRHITRTYYIKPKNKKQQKRKGLEQIEKAKEVFGVTYDPRKGGYLLPDGSFLDFSMGEKKRIADHRDIAEIYDQGGTEAVYRFMNETGAIRWSFYGDSLWIETVHEPTKAQYATIAAVVHHYAPEVVTIDVSTPDMKTVQSIELERPTRQKVRQTLRRAFSRS